MTEPFSLLDAIPGEIIVRKRALADAASSSMAKDTQCLQAPSVETSPQRMSAGTLTPGGLIRMCLVSHLAVTIEFVLAVILFT
jgi:hypothetical protein